MARPPALYPTRSLNTHLDERLMVKVDLLLFSELEGRVPKGAYKAFLESLIRRALNQRELDLSPYTGELPATSVVYGQPETITTLEKLLQGTKS